VTIMGAPPAGERRQLLAALPTAPGLARAFVVQTMRPWPVADDCRDITELLASELVTNATRQTGRVDGPPTPHPTETVAVLGVRISLRGRAVRLEVWDNDPRPATLATPSPEDESGRGLLLVDTLSRAWGNRPSALGGKVVWCEVPRDGVVVAPKPPALPPLPKRKRQTPNSDPRKRAAWPPPDVELLERVLMGLRRLKTQ
jgi:Histidine kinase-like ATPase domain